VAPGDGEWAPPDRGDELVAKVIPLRRRGDGPKAPEILADEPHRSSEAHEHPPAPSEWSIWQRPPEELRLREREPAPPPILRKDPARAADPSQGPPGPSEWSVWGLPPAHLDLRRAGDAARVVGRRARLRGRRPSRRHTAAAAAAAVLATAAVALTLYMGALEGQPGPVSERASSGLHANRPTSSYPGLRKHSVSRPHRSAAAPRRSRRNRRARHTAGSAGSTPEFAAAGTGSGVSATVRYQPTTSQSPSETATSPPTETGSSPPAERSSSHPTETTASPPAQTTSPPPAESTPPAQESSATASANREFGFEH
jgi:hypothetical protein